MRSYCIIWILLILTFSESCLCAPADTVQLENHVLSLKFAISKEGLFPIQLENLRDKITLQAKSSHPICNYFPDKVAISVSHKQYVERATMRHAGFARLESIFEYDGYSVVHYIDLYDSLSVYAHRMVVHIQQSPLSNPQLEADSASSIEDPLTLVSKEPWYSLYPFTGHNYTLSAVNFFEATDYHSNPVQVTHYAAYAKKSNLAGNLFLIHSGEHGSWDFILKEAPIGNVQVNYTGHDAAIENGKVAMKSPGIDYSLIDRKQEAYAVIYGIGAKSRYDLLLLLQQYKMASNRYVPEVDNTFTINTWGDRNRDSRISEKFIANELIRSSQLGITHYQIDDGWQRGLSKNTASGSGTKWRNWSREDWEPHPDRFPNGFKPLLKLADSLDMQLGLWYNPGGPESYSDTSFHLAILRQMHKNYNVRQFKIDGVELGSKNAEYYLDEILKNARRTCPDIVFNMDVTADGRGGYNFLEKYGSIFLENRYTDWANYYPHLTLRNAWLLAHYLPIQRIQLSFLNKWRNIEKYPKNQLEPFAYGFDYLFAITMFGQPLAWFEATGLPTEADKIVELVSTWKSHRDNWTSQPILPIGEEPSGYSFTGFMSNNVSGRQYFLIFRENSDKAEYTFPLKNNKKRTKILYRSASGSAKIDGGLRVFLPSKRSFIWGYVE